MFSRTVSFAVLCVFLSVSASAQRIIIKKSATGRVSTNSNRENNENRNDNRVNRGNLASDENQIYNLINSERGKKGLNPLDWDDRLAQLARSYSRKMAKESFFSHFDRNGDSVVERAKDSNIRGWNKIGENLFYCEGYNDFDLLAVRGWMNSSEHRRNILDRQYTTTGIGAAQSRDGKIYITQIFIRE